MKALIDAIGIRAVYNPSKTVCAFSIVGRPNGGQEVLKYQYTADLTASELNKALKETLSEFPVWDRHYKSLPEAVHALFRAVALSSGYGAPTVMVDNHLFFYLNKLSGALCLLEAGGYYAIHKHPSYNTMGFTIPFEIAEYIRTSMSDKIQCVALGQQ